MKNGRLFVYGTLRRGARTEMAALLRRHAVHEAEGTLQGRLFQVAHYPGVVPSEDPSDQVQGDVYRMTNAEALLARLDEYEGCGPDEPGPTEYVRRQQQILLPDGQRVRAWVYIYNRPTDGLRRIPSGDFVRFRQGRARRAPGKLRSGTRRRARSN